jgi:hypothetical protein
MRLDAACTPYLAWYRFFREHLQAPEQQQDGKARPQPGFRGAEQGNSGYEIAPDESECSL